MARGMRERARLLHCPMCHKGFWSQVNYQKYCPFCSQLRYRKQTKEWWKKNRAKVAMKSRLYRVTHPEQRREVTKRWIAKNDLLARMVNCKAGFRSRYKTPRMGDLLFLINIMKKPCKGFSKDKKVANYLRRVCHGIEATE